MKKKNLVILALILLVLVGLELVDFFLLRGRCPKKYIKRRWQKEGNIYLR